MRLLSAILIATLLSALLDFMSYQSTGGEQLLNVSHQNHTRAGIALKNPLGASNVVDPQNAENINFDWLWLSLSKVLLFVLFGWALAKIYLQFRVLVAIFLGLVIIVIFLLDFSGVIEVIFHYEKLEKLFAFFRSIVMEMRLADFLAILVGIWAGYAGHNPAFRQQGAIGKF